MASLFGGVVAAVMMMTGCVMPLRDRRLTPEGSHAYMAFAAGVLLGTAFFHLIPESAPEHPYGLGAGLALAFVTIFAAEHFTLVHACPEDCEGHEHTAMSAAALGAMAAHSLFDGVAVGAAFSSSWQLGGVTTAAVALHRFPVGLSLASILRQSGRSRAWTLTACGFVSVLAVVGAAMADQVGPQLVRGTHGGVLGFIAGAFIYLGATDMLPRFHHSQTSRTILCFTGGILATALAALLHGHLAP